MSSGRRANTSASAAMRLLMREVPTLITSLPATSEGQLTLTFADQHNQSDLFHLHLITQPSGGMWAGGRIVFEIEVAPDYPFGRSKVRCQTPIYHPNINLEGHVCLNILREDFSPAIHIEQICQGLLFLLLQPNPDSPLNEEAARELADSPDVFSRHVRLTLEGGTLHGRRYNRSLVGNS
jgi:ubiquitin-conjugating enzyme E2 M